MRQKGYENDVKFVTYPKDNDKVRFTVWSNSQQKSLHY